MIYSRRVIGLIIDGVNFSLDKMARNKSKFKFKFSLVQLVQRLISLTTRQLNTQQTSHHQYTQRDIVESLL